MTLKHCFLGFLISFFLTGVVETQSAPESLKPQRVHFQSRNFHNILHWQPGRACTSNSSVYFVQYKIFSVFNCCCISQHILYSNCKIFIPLSFPFYRYGQRQWKNKEDCWGILEFFCDLTNETSEIQEPYYGRVRTTSAGIHSGWTMTQRFTPWWESEFHGVSLYLLFLPLSSPTEQAVCFAELYGIISFDLILRTTEQKVYEGAGRVVKIGTLAPHAGYCVVAEMYQPMLDRRSQRSKEQCVELP
uniref:Interleukin 22 receptor subunit alpha 2 n=1 Tax=Ursus americanus TaxID=9643 RepID=A0A452RS96_URSAM